MRKLLALTFLVALVPALSPATAHPATLAQRVAKLEAKLACVTKTPVTSWAGYAGYGVNPLDGNPSTGSNGANVYDPPAGATTPNPDSLTDEGWLFALDWNFGNNTPDYWVLNVKANANNVVTSTCASKFPKQVTPSWWSRSPTARMTHLRQLSRVELH